MSEQVGHRRTVEHEQRRYIAQVAAPYSGTMSTAPFGSITDVAGVRVGHHQRTGRGWQTGTTVVFVPDGTTPGVSVRGGGPGTRETDALRPENLVELIHAVCLTGGSAFGLAAADGVVGWLEQQGLGFPIGPAANPAAERVGVVPVVPAAVVFDLGRGGNFANRPDAQFGRRSVERARRAQGSWGSVGAGTGARASGLQGGVGTAGTIVTISGDIMGTPGVDAQVSVGAVAVVNANGSPIDPSSGLPWTPLARLQPGAGLDLRRPSAVDRARLRGALAGHAESSLNTTIGVVATSAALTKSEVSKIADVAHDGLARAIRPAHSLFDGDTVFGLATGAVDLGSEPAAMGSAASRQRAVNQLLTAAADMFELACVHAVIGAERRGTSPSYAELCPSAFRLRSLT
jgi:L-aminopeptidase/D-esterase-like protein